MENLLMKLGAYYIGQIKNGLRNGNGKIYYANGNIQFEGYFINDKPEGIGKYIYKNGNYFIGQFKNGLRNGKVKEYYENGNIKLESDYINGECVENT